MATITGTPGNDTLKGSDNQPDIINGLAGDDALFGRSGAGAGVEGDTLDGGTGFDVVSYARSYQSLSIDLALHRATHAGSDAQDTVNRVEGVIGGDWHDFINGDANANRLDGAAGNDTIHGGGGKDTLVGGTGDDGLWGGSGTDTIDGGEGFDLAVYRENTGPIRIDLNIRTASFPATNWQSEYLFAIEGAETGAGNDTLIGDDGDNQFIAGAGADQLQGRHGQDTLDGGAGKDTIDGGTGADTASFAPVSVATTIDLANQTAFSTASPNLRDTLVSIESAIGGAGNDRILGTSSFNWLGGGAGADTIDGRGGQDTLVGGYGNDSLRGGGGDDTLTGGPFAEDQRFPGHRDLADDGRDRLDGGDGIDTVVFPAMAEYVPELMAYFDLHDSVDVNLAAGTLGTSYGSSVDTLISIENVRTGNGSDSVVGNAAANLIEVGNGANVVFAGGGSDTIEGGSFTYSDDEAGGRGDRLYGGGGNDLIFGNGSTEIDFTFDPGSDYLNGGAGNDTLYGERASLTMSGGSGADEFHLADELVFSESGGVAFFAPIAIEDFSRQDGDHIFIDMKETGASVRFVGETADLDLYDLGYQTVDDDTVVHLRMGSSGLTEFMEITLSDYTGGLSSDDFTFT